MHNVLSLCPCTAFETKAEFEAFIGPSIDFYENSVLSILLSYQTTLALGTSKGIGVQIRLHVLSTLPRP